MKFFRVKPAKERKVVFLRKRWLAIPGALLCICALCLVTTLPSYVSASTTEQMCIRDRACGMLFFCGIVFGNGRVRLYMALCLLLGATAYFLLLSPWTRRALDILARAAARFLGWVTAPLRWLIRVLTAPLAKILRKWKKTWKKFFSFSRLWSTICHLIGKHGKSVAPERQETEAAPHVPIQKGWSSCEDHSADPVGLHDLHPGQRPAKN